jgi:hypothetical protein
MKLSLILLAVPLPGFLGCNVTDEHSSSPSFAIYKLKDSTVMASQVWDMPIDSLALADVPFLPQDSITSYNWQLHEFTATASIDTFLSYLGSHLGPLGGMPFVVTVGRDRIYLGAFWFPRSSLSPMVPYIDPWLNSHRIQRSWNPADTVDKRNDPRIYSALKDAGILVE